jgi:transposase
MQSIAILQQGGMQMADESPLRDWMKEFSEDPQHAFPGQGQMKPEQLEIVRLKHEVTKLKAERDILKKAAAYFAKEST